MGMVELDEIDRGILHLLQQDARHQTAGEIASELPVSGQTVRNRIKKLEEAGIIEGYVPLIDYRNAGFGIRIKYVCTAPVDGREEVVEQVLQLPHVVSVDEMLSARDNLSILAVTNDSEEINELTRSIADLDLVIEREALLRRTYLRPFNHFGEDYDTDTAPNESSP